MTSKKKAARFASQFWARPDKKSETAKQTSTDVTTGSLKRKHAHRTRLRKHRYTAYFVSSMIVLCTAAVSFFSWDERVAIGEIQITGNRTIPTHILLNAIHEVIFSSDNGYIAPRTIATVDTTRIENLIAYQFPKIERVVASRSISNTLFVHIDERIPVAAYCTNTDRDECYQVDATGYIFQRQDDANGVVFFGGVYGNPLRQKILSGAFPKLTSVVEALSRELVTPLSVEIGDDARQFSVKTSEGPTFIFLTTAPEHETTRIIQNLLKSASIQGILREVAYFDLRFGDRVFMKRLGDTPPSFVEQSE